VDRRAVLFSFYKFLLKPNHYACFDESENLNLKQAFDHFPAAVIVGM
jgi:hypothetical protein